MNFKTLTLSIAGIALAFVLVGDRVLPKPVSTYSLNARTSMSKVLAGLVPHLKPQKPNAETEKAVDSLKP
jgi:hypothetical protein